MSKSLSNNTKTPTDNLNGPENWKPHQKKERKRVSVIRKAPKVTNPFQSLITAIEMAIAPKEAKVTSSYEVDDNGIPREADILIEFLDNGQPSKIVIECRDHEPDQDIKWIDQLVGKYQNTDINKIIAVSTTPFTAAAQKKAQNHQIELRTMREAEESDWGIELTKTYVKQINVKDIPTGIRFEVEGKLPLPTLDRLLITNVLDLAGNIIGPVTELAKSLYFQHAQASVAHLINSDPNRYLSKAIDSNYDYNFEIIIPKDSGILENFDGQLTKLVFQVQIEIAFIDVEAKHFIYNQSAVTLANANVGDQVYKAGFVQYNTEDNERRFKIIFDKLSSEAQKNLID